MKNNDEQMVNCLMMWILFLSILMGACLAGLIGAILQAFSIIWKIKRDVLEEILYS